jgi:succinate-acetate transporter protein
MTSASQRPVGARHGSTGGAHDPGGGSSIARIVVRPPGSPLPLGFFAFAVGTFAFAMYQLEAIPADELQTVAPLVLGIYKLTGDTALQTASGIAGLVVVGIATYGGVALMIEDTAQRTIWPIARRGVSKMSLEGGINDQLERLGNEPGVRAQL